MDLLNSAIIGAVCTGLGVLISKGIDFFRASRSETREDKKVDADIDKSETSQALEMYKELIQSLKEDTKDLLANLHKLEGEHLACREENIKLRMEVQNLQERVNSLEEELSKKKSSQAPPG